MSRKPGRKKPAPAKLGDVASVLRAVPGITQPSAGGSLELKRHVLADFCRLVGARLSAAENPNSISNSRNISSSDSNQIAQATRMKIADAAPESSDGSRGERRLPHLSPRMRQTLRLLLEGDAEKQIAHKLRRSQHTVHVYVKALYRGFGVNSRGELMSRFVAAGGSIDSLRDDDPPLLQLATG